MSIDPITFLPPTTIGSYMYHLRVYIYQARNMTSMDKDSFSGEIVLDGQKYN